MPRCGILALAVVLVNLPAGCVDAGETFRERCEKYAKEHAALPVRQTYCEFQSEELTELLRSAGLAPARKCLGDPDPKVRTLGALALGLGDDPSVLPHLAPLLSDHAATLDRTWPDLSAEGKPDPPTFTHQDVAAVATRVVREWTGLDGPIPQERFRAYWGEVNNPEQLVHVWLCRLRRAEFRNMREIAVRVWRGFDRLPGPAPGMTLEERQAAARELQEESKRRNRRMDDALRKKAERVRGRLAAQDPSWLQAVVALSWPSSNVDFWTDEERASLVRRHVPRGSALACLRRAPPFNDPHLRPGRGWHYGLLCKRLLLAVDWRPEDTETILRIEIAEYKHRNPMTMAEWAIAASRANPDQARSRQVLKAALNRESAGYDREERHNLVRELLSIAGLDETLYFVNLFYRDSDGAIRYPLVEHSAGAGQDGRRFLAAVLRDPRSARISSGMSWGIVPAITSACNRLEGREIIEAKLSGLHPCGWNASKQDLERAKRLYPEKTDAALKKIEEWRQRLVRHVVESKW